MGGLGVALVTVFLFCLACKLMRTGHLIPGTEVTAGSELCSECWEPNPGPQQSGTFAQVLGSQTEVLTLETNALPTEPSPEPGDWLFGQNNTLRSEPKCDYAFVVVD